MGTIISRTFCHSFFFFPAKCNLLTCFPSRSAAVLVFVDLQWPGHTKEPTTTTVIYGQPPSHYTGHGPAVAFPSLQVAPCPPFPTSVRGQEQQRYCFPAGRFHGQITVSYIIRRSGEISSRTRARATPHYGVVS